MRVIGLMSGTSFDGIDAAAADLSLEDDAVILRPLGHVAAGYPSGLRQALAAVLPPAVTDVGEIARLDTLIGQAFAVAAARANTELCDGRAELVVSHGQTVFHWIEDGRAHGSLQLGEPAWIAEALDVAVVSHLRNRDIAAGGQGAPLVSVFDVLLLGPGPPVRAALNIGGVANLTVIPIDGDPIAFDTGPGNALIDAAARHYSGGELAFDVDGRMAGRGRVVQRLLAAFLADPYFGLAPPKSTGKEHFNRSLLLEILASVGDIDSADVLATVTELTAQTIADDCRRFGVAELVVSGGGTRNPTLMTRLAEAASEARIVLSDELGIPTMAKEAYAFALLGFLTVQGIPSTIPSCTGARRPSILGRVTPGPTGLPALTPSQPVPRRLVVVQAADQPPVLNTTSTK